MELIIKPTEACNFKCTFCSSTSIAESKVQLLSLDQIFQFLKRFPETNTIIVNGGDPLSSSVRAKQQYLGGLGHPRRPAREGEGSEEGAVTAQGIHAGAIHGAFDRNPLGRVLLDEKAYLRVLEVALAQQGGNQ